MKTRRKTSAQTRIQVHIVLAPRYRRQLFASDDISTLFSDAIRIMCAEENIAISQLDFGADYLHLYADIPPELSVADVVSRVKRCTTRMLRESTLPERDISQIWTRSYFADTAEIITKEEIDKYLDTLKKR